MRIVKASAAMAGLTKKVWKNTMLTIKSKTQVYQACVLSTLLYGSESWTPYTQQERRFTDPQKGLHSATKTCSSRTSRRVALRQQALKRWQRTAAVGDTLPSQLSRQQRRRERSSGKKIELAGAREQRQIQHPWTTMPSHAATVTGSAVRGSASTATVSAAALPRTDIHGRKLHCFLR